MASRYRSQIFNAFSRQSRRLSDRVAQTWRQAKLTATWGTQILLYPIYALYQGTRVVSRQIGQTVQRLPQLQPTSEIDPANSPLDELTDLDAPVDTPIVRSIAALAGLELSNLTPILPAAEGAITVTNVAPIVVVELPGAIESRPETNIETATVRVRGIASRLDDRRLVLATIHNALLELNAQQHIQLQQRIVWELASYRRLVRLRTSATKPLPLPADAPNLLPPVRLLRRMMAWMQQSPIAIATNLFGEAALLDAAPPAPVLTAAPEPRSIPPSPWSWLTGMLRPPAPSEPIAPGQTAAIVATETASMTATTSARPKRDRWWKRKRLAENATAQDSIAVAGRDSAALPSVGSNRQLSKTERSTVAASDAVAAGGLAIDTEAATPAAAPNFIETPATLVGYVKHPLAQLLEWVDAGMLWIETRLSNLWNWLHGR